MNAATLRVEQRRSVVQDLAAQGFSIHAIARQLGVHRKTVSRDLAPRAELKAHRPLKDRVLEHVQVNEETGCWEWTGRIRENGYGCLKSVCPDGRIVMGAHRNAWLAFVGPIPDGYDVDHLCHTYSDCAGGPQCPHRRCVNPGHLEPVTRLENVRRSKVCGKATCLRGHPLEGANVYIDRNGWRRCKQCRRVT